MRITLFTIGARGDTQPFVALAARLKHEGHRVKLAARPDFAGLAEEYGVEFAPLGHPYQPFITGAAVAAALGSGNVFNQLRYGWQQRHYVFDQVHEDAWRAAQGAEAIIYKYSWTAGYTIAEKLGIPCAAAMLFPLTPTRAFPSFLVGRGVDHDPLLNRLVWTISQHVVVWQLQRSEDNALRRELGLRPLPFFGGPYARQAREEMPVYYAYSPTVLPCPADWPERMQVTGYWFLDPPPGWQPSDVLLQFLRAGPPPVSIGFGSMASRDADATLRLVLEALELSGQRGVLLSGWAGLGKDHALPEYAFAADNLPHSWLFPQMAAVVHHGGAGTTGAGLRSGVPSILVPLTADQPSWARMLHALGVGPAPIPFQTLTAERLASAIRQAVSDPAMRQRAADLGKQIQEEDGLSRATESFTCYVEQFGAARNR